ncbi:MAG: type II CAAX endopeptidase family protein [Pseudomonadota bacterium]
MIGPIYAPWPERARRPWGAAALALAALAYLVSAVPVVLVTIGYAAYQAATGADIATIDQRLMTEDALTVFFPALLGQFATWLVLTLIWLSAWERRTLATIGLGGERFAARYLRGLIVGVVIALGLGLAALVLTPQGAVSNEAASLAEGFDASGLFTGAVLGALVFIALGFLFQGAVEEVIFRGWLLSALGSRWGVALAAFASCGLFSLLHLHVFASGAVLGTAAIIGITMTGLFFAAYALSERSLAGVMGAHGAFNATIVIASMLPRLGRPDADPGIVFGEVLQQATALSRPEDFQAGPQIWVQSVVFGALAIVLALRLMGRKG